MINRKMLRIQYDNPDRARKCISFISPLSVPISLFIAQQATTSLRDGSPFSITKVCKNTYLSLFKIYYINNINTVNRKFPFTYHKGKQERNLVFLSDLKIKLWIFNAYIYIHTLISCQNFCTLVCK